MAEHQFKMRITDNSTDKRLEFTVMYANEGSAEWTMLASYPSRIEATAFIDGIIFTQVKDLKHI